MAANLGLMHRAPPCAPITNNMAALVPPNNMANPGQPYSTMQTNYLYPPLPTGVTEPVVVTQILGPHRLFCQLMSMSRAIHTLSEELHRYYEAQMGYGDQGPPLALGQPCASRGTDGRWHRSLLQELSLEKQLATVVHVDCGMREIIPLSALRNLAAEFFRLPVFTYPCVLYGVSNGGLAWNLMPVSDMYSLLLGRHVNARIECYNSYEHLYGVTLLAEDGMSFSHHLGMLSLSNKMCQNNPPNTPELPPLPEKVCMEQPHFMSKYPPVELKVGKFEDAVVEFVIDPSSFWVRLERFAGNHKQMVDGMTTFYSKASDKQLVPNQLRTGQICCAHYLDSYYRVEVISADKLVKVFFLDIGISEVVDWSNIRELPAEFSKLPALANKCCLADTFPMIDDTWSQEAILAFKVAVTDRRIIIHVVSKDVDEYIIEIIDQSRIKEKNVGKILAKAGLAVFEELETANGHTNGENIAQAESAKTVLGVDVLDCVTKSKETTASYVCEDDTEPVHYSPFQEQLYDPGSKIEVAVSHVDSPVKFWCQNARSKRKLSSLMDDIQSHCMSTDVPYTSSTRACLAKSSRDGRWYRASITKLPVNISKTSTVEVFYVDYGNRETVLLTDLRAINGEFFQLKAQAFKCSLYNIITPTGGNPFLWDSKATAVFQEFIQKASDYSEFHCLVYATASLREEPFNIVDLCIPFNSACKTLVDRGYATHLYHKALAPCVQLSSYYYSEHDLKAGGEMDIYVTHVESSSLFYAQLDGNATLDIISSTIARVIEKTQKTKLPPISGALCLAKYSDQQWYRVHIQSETGSQKIFFVDFGNTEEVPDDILPIMSCEQDLLLLPMQAIKCSLAGISSTVSTKVDVTWFEAAVMEKTLKAVIVGKESDGKLVVDLYEGNLHINTALINKFDSRNGKEKLNCHQPSTFKQDDSRRLPNNVRIQERKTFLVTKNVKSREPDTCHIGVTQKPEPCYRKSPIYPYKAENNDYNSHSQDSFAKRKIETPSQKMETIEGKVEPVQRVSSSGSYQGSLGRHDAKQDGSKTLPQRQSTSEAKRQSLAKLPMVTLDDIPKRKIIPNMKAPMYISYVDSVFDFFVQAAEDNRLDEMSEILNNETSSFEVLGNEDINVGDVICAFFPDDGLYYRGEVKEKTKQGLRVVYIDYGNSKVISDCKNYRLPQKCHSIPVMSIRCSLSKPKNVLTAPNLLEEFSKRTTDIQLDCEFQKLDGEKWEVILKDELGCINDLLAASEEPVLEENIQEVSDKVMTMKIVKEEETTVSAFTWNLPELGATVKVYVSAVDGPDSFWCQLSVADIDSLASQVQESGEQSIKSDDFIGALMVGSPCNVIYSEDNNWYRALVTLIEADLVTVRFIDYGNVDYVGRDQIQQLPEFLVKIPPQAFSCRLADFDMKAGTWSSEGKTYFYENVTKDVVELTVHEIRESGSCHLPVAFVTINYDGSNINEEMKKFWQELQSTELALPDESAILSAVDLTEADQPHSYKESPTTDSSNLGESTPEGHFEECVCLGEDRILQKNVIRDLHCPPHGDEQESDTDGVEGTVDLHRRLHADVAVEDADALALSDCEPQDMEGLGDDFLESGYPEDAAGHQFPNLKSSCQQGTVDLHHILHADMDVEDADALSDCDPRDMEGLGDDVLESGQPEDAAGHQFSNLKSSCQQEMLPRDASESLESLILRFNEQLVLSNKEAISDNAAKEEVTTRSEIIEDITIVAEDETEEFDDSTRDETEEDNESFDVLSEDFMESKDPLTTNEVVQSEEMPQRNDGVEEATFSEDHEESGDTTGSDILETNSFASDALDKAGEAAPDIMIQDSETVESSEITDENVPSVIKDVHTIQNIVTNEDLEGCDAVEAVEVNEENKEDVASEDVTDEDIVDDMVPAEPLEIEPEEDVLILQDETIKEDVESCELVISEDVTSEDDKALVFYEVDMFESEDPLDVVIVTEGEEDPANQDGLGSEAIHAKDFSGNEETASGEVTTEDLETITSKDFVKSDTVETNEITDENVPSVIKDVHKIENIVTNEDLEGCDAVEAVEVNEENKEDAASEDVTDEDIVDDMVPAEPLEIEPEEDVLILQDETIKEDVESCELVISEDVTSEDDKALVFYEVDMFESEDPLDVVTVTECQEDPANQDVLGSEAIHAKDFSGNEETASGEGTADAFETIINKYFVKSDTVETNEITDENVLSVIKDVHKIENIVTNEDLEGREAIKVSEENEDVDSEDVTDEDIVDDMVPAELLEIEPEEDVLFLQDETINENVESCELVIFEDVTSEDDTALVFYEVDMFESEDPLDVVAVTEGQEDPANQDVLGSDAIDAEDFSGNEETASGEVTTEDLKTITSKDLVKSEQDLTSCDLLECWGVTGTDLEDVIQEDEEVLSLGVFEDDSKSFDKLKAIADEDPFIELYQHVVASANEGPIAGEDKELKGRMKREETVACDDVDTEDTEAFKEVFCESLSTDFNDYEETKVSHGFVETVKAESSRHVVEHVGAMPSKDFVQSVEDLSSCDTNEFEGETEEDEEFATPEGATEEANISSEEANISSEELEDTVVEGTLINLDGDVIGSASEGPEAGEDMKWQDSKYYEEVELKDRMSGEEDVGTEASAFEEAVCESLSTDDINDDEEPETIQELVNTCQQNVDCDRDDYDPSEDTFLPDNTNTRQRETEQDVGECSDRALQENICQTDDCDTEAADSCVSRGQAPEPHGSGLAEAQLTPVTEAAADQRHLGGLK